MLATPFVLGGKMGTKIKNKYTNTHKKYFFQSTGKYIIDKQYNLHDSKISIHVILQ